MFQMFERMGIGRKLILGLVAILLLTSILGIMSVSGIGKIVHYVGIGDDQNRIVKFAKDLRIVEKNYIARDQESYIPKMEEMLGKMKKQVTETGASVKNAKEHELMERIEKEIENYRKAFESYVDLNQASKNALQGMIDSARGMQKQAMDLRTDQKNQMKSNFSRSRVDKADDANRLLRFVNEIRIIEKNYIHRQHDKYVSALSGTFESAREQILKTRSKMKRQINVDQMNAMMSALNGYRKAFEEFDRLNREKKRKEELMVAAARDLVTQAEEARKIAKEEMHATEGSTENLIIGFALMAILLGVFVAFLVNRSVNTGISQTLNQVNELVQSVNDGKLDMRGNPDDVGIDFREIVEGFNAVVDAFAAPFNVMAEYVDRISKGDIPPKITDEYRGDFNEIKNNLNNNIDVISRFVDDLGVLMKAVENGKLDVRAESENFNGVWHKMMAGTNEIVDSFMKPFKVAAEYVDRISRGDMSSMIEEEYKGDFNDLKNSINQLITINVSILGGLKRVVENINDGKLDDRGDSKKFEGEWKNLVEGINQLIDALVGPINVTAEYIDRISRGTFLRKLRMITEGTSTRSKTT